MNRTMCATIPLLCLAGPMLMPAQAPQTESVRPPSSHKIALAVTGLLGWRVGAQSAGFNDATFFDAAVKTDAAGLGAIEAFSSQKVSAAIAKSFDSNLSAPEQDAIRKKLKGLALHLAAYHVDKLGPGDRKVLEFAKSLGADMVIAPVSTDTVAAVDKMAGEARHQRRNRNQRSKESRRRIATGEPARGNRNRSEGCGLLTVSPLCMCAPMNPGSRSS